jgi:hypothetical protein
MLKAKLEELSAEIESFVSELSGEIEATKAEIDGFAEGPRRKAPSGRLNNPCCHRMLFIKLPPFLKGERGGF